MFCMAIDEMKIDPNVLEFTRVLIDRYIKKQQTLLTEYHSKIRSLAQAWNDDSGYGEMEKKIELFTKNSVETLETINTTYRKFLWDEVIDIRKNLEAINKK